MMTPQEVANCTFARELRGYNMEAVDNFLDKLTEDYGDLYKENSALKTKLKMTVDKMAEYKESEDAIRSTLLAAQKMSTAMINEAERKRDALIEEGTRQAKDRLAQLQLQIAEEERRLEEARAQVDRQLEVERRRLEAGQNVLRAFIRDVRAVCQEELDHLELLPELPVEDPPAPPPLPEPQAEEAALPAGGEPEDGGEAVAASAEADLVQRNLHQILSSFNQEEAEPQEAGAPAQDPFQGGGDPEDASATRIMNLDDLQFGPNYKRD